MRALIRRLILAAGAAAAFAPPAFAQTIREQMALEAQESQLRAREAMVNRQAVGIQNQMQTLDAQLRTQQSLSDVRAQSYSPRLPAPQGVPPAAGAAPYIDTSKLASIPDDKLAASTRRVREASRNHH